MSAQRMDDEHSGNGSGCATCEIPPRTDRLEMAQMRLERDAIGVIAELRALDTRLFARLNALDAAIAETHRIVAEVLTAVRLMASR